MTKAPLHLAEVHRSVRAEGGTRSYFAACSLCGWTGPQRTTQAQAEQDAHEHHRTTDGP